MSDQELNHIAAEEVMGWQKVDADWRSNNGETFAWIYYGEKQSGVDWNPTQDWNHTMKLVYESARRGTTIDISFILRQVRKVRFNDIYYEMVNGDLQRTICIAAILSSQSV